MHNVPGSECETALHWGAAAAAQHNTMLELLTDRWVRLFVLSTAIVILILAGGYIASKWRGTNDNDRMSTQEMLTKFREMHSEGVLTDEEFRTIKSKLAGDIQLELKDADKPACDSSNDN